MRILRSLLIVACLLVFVLPSTALAATLPPDFYLPTVDELPSGVELKESPGQTPVGIKGGAQEQRIYASSLPPAVLSVTVLTLDPEMAPQRYGSAFGPLSQQGYVISRTNAPGDVDLVQAGPELSRHLRVVLVGQLIGMISVLFNNGLATDAEATALSDAVAGPLLAKMQAHPDGV